ncbi:MAG: prolipoprotein diacylglyceryl transferase [Sphingomonadales bacterium]|nr:prolipoprotein diacylglyceryl transferase [Sphingomonadales bacterium]
MYLEFLAAAASHISYTDLGIGPIALDLGFFKLRWYSLSYLVMILLGYWYLTKLIQKPGAPMSRAHADDLILYMTLGVILGGRFGYILFYDQSLLAFDKFYRVWEGGMSLHGGTLGVLFALWIFVRKHKLSYLRVCDYIAVCVPFGTFLVRLANFANGELWGRETDVPWAMRFPEVVQGATLLGPPRHPSQLYEAVFEGLVMAAILWPLFWKTDARYKPGFLFGLAALIYGTARFTIEYFRQPDLQLQWLVDATGFSMGQFLTMPMILLGLFLIFTANKRRQRVEPVMGGDSVA